MSPPKARPSGNGTSADRAMHEAIKALEEARPSSGYQPSTEQEWARVGAAVEKLAFAMYLSTGASKEEAHCLAKTIHSGPAGRLLLEMAFGDEEVKP